jgi:multidrug resistance efflux pump
MQRGVDRLKKTVKIVMIAGIALAVIGAIAWAAVQPQQVECVALESTTLENAFTEMGEVVPVAEEVIYAKNGGKLIEIRAVEGSRVEKGGLLFVFDGSDLKNREDSLLSEIVVLNSQIKGQIVSLEMQRNSLATEKSSAEFQAEQARVGESQANEHLKATKSLHEAGGVSTQDLLNAQAAWEMAASSRELAYTQLERLNVQIAAVNKQAGELRTGRDVGRTRDAAQEETNKQQLLAQRAAYDVQLSQLRESQGELELSASMDGVVMGLSVKAGQIVAPGQKLCSVYQPDQYKVECYVLVEDTEGIKAGDHVGISLPMRGGDRKLAGKVSFLAQGAVEKISSVGLSEKRVKAEISTEGGGWESVGPYWPVEIRFITESAKDCLVVPKTALIEEAGQGAKVHLVRDGVIVAAPVERGVQTPTQVEIRGEFAPGDSIVKNVKTSNAREGQKVKAVH